MNKFQKNIIIVGFSQDEIRNMSIPPIGEIHYLDNLNDIKKHQGYLLIINNSKNVSLVELDKKYRKYFNKYEKIWLYNKTNKNYFDKFSRIELINDDLFLDLSLTLWEEYDEYKIKKSNLIENKLSVKTQNNIDILKEYLKKYKTIKTSFLVDSLGINARTIQRYMNLINDKYHNIGYDYSKNEWYIIK